MPAPAPSRTVLHQLMALVLLLAFSTALQPQIDPQFSSVGQSQPIDPINFGGPKDMPDHLAKLAMVKRLNADRQKQMTASADRLLRLAADLKAENGRAGAAPTEPAGQSSASIKKAEEIAKLAHTIRQKMVEDYSIH